MPGTGKIGLSSQVGRLKFARAYYDFAVDGGAIGAITLRGDTLPSGAVILDSLVEVNTLVTTASSGTVALSVESAADLRAAATPATGPLALSTTGLKRALVTYAATPVKTTAARSVTATVATGAITAGAFSVILAYVELS
jgi:hypothetical protein